MEKDNWFTRNNLPETYEWSEYRNRARVVGDMINSYFKDGLTIVDYGCGKMTVLEFLKIDYRYIAIDIVSRCEGCIVCDLDDENTPLPDVESELVICTGVLGKLDCNNRPRLIDHIKSKSKYLLINEVQNYKICLNRGLELVESREYSKIRPEENYTENPHFLYLMKMND
ncbi:MAG: class I SAM-dependent methyltransferase [Opitutales bacterium]|nr:class I SAM-dependent methyltransferase [Opitutales bacterium]